MKYLLSLALLVSFPVVADVVDVTWTAPTTRVDGTPLTAAEIKHYRLSWTVKGVAQPDKTVTGTSYALDTGTLSGRTCVVLRTVDTDNLESDPTSAVCRNAKPNPPSNVSAR